MDFRILGPLEVLSDGRALDLGGQKQRSLLAMLLLEANKVVSSERLIDALWEQEPPETAGKALQVYVSQLRKLLGRERLQTKAPGYLLRVESDELDLARFERLQEAGSVEDALSLWRGPPLGDLAQRGFAQAEIARLEELHLACLEERIERGLAGGRHAELAGELEALTREYPLREGLRGQLMLCLYRSGRQAEALQVYAATRKELVEELGIEPGRDLRALHQAILEQDPALDLAMAPEPIAETPRGAFVGREAELAELVHGLEAAFAGRGGLFLLVGEPGIGKSRLAEELTSNARARGARVLVGRCWEAGGAPAYWPWVQALRGYVRATEPEALAAQLGDAADLAQLLPELRRIFPQLPEPPALGSEGARFRLFEGVSSFLRNAARVSPLVLVLDDLHAADEPSLLMLQFVAREIADSRLLMVCAFRDVDPTLRDPLISALAQLVREPPTAQVGLSGLSEQDVSEYIELSTGVEPATLLAQAIHAETEGNPLFVTETVRLLDADGRITEAGARLRIPPGVRAVILQRLRRLSDACRNVLLAGSVMGREFELDALMRLSELPRDALLDMLDEALAERVVTDVPGSPGRLRFGHALIRDTLYEQLTSATRLRLHRQAGEALEAVYSADLEPHLAELAHHFFAAAPAGVADKAKAIEYAQRAGDRALGLLAYEESARLYEMALTLIDQPIARGELLLALGDAHARAGDTPAAKHAFREAAELAARHDLPEHLARAALGYGGRLHREASRDDEYLVPLLEGALAALGDVDTPLRVRLLARLAGGPLRDASFPPERKAALSAQALESARRLGDRATLAYAIQGYIGARHSPAHTRRQLELASELVGVATWAGDNERVVEGRAERLESLIELGDISGAKAELESMAQLAQQLRQPSQDWLVTVYRALFALLEGRLAEAEGLISGARGMGESAQNNAAVSYRIQLYLLRREQGRLEEVEDLIRRSVNEYRTYPIWRCVLAQMAAQLGHVGEARAALEALAAGSFASLPFDEEWLVSMGLLAETATALDDAQHASALYRLLLPYGDRVALSYTEISTGAVALYLGLLAAVMKRWDDAQRHFEEALATNERIGAPGWLAHTQEDYARMLLERGASGDREKALKLLADALVIYRHLGMETRAHAVDRKPSPTPRTPAAGAEQ